MKYSLITSFLTVIVTVGDLLRTADASSVTRELPPAALQERFILQEQHQVFANANVNARMPDRHLLEATQAVTSKIRADILKDYDVMSYPFQYLWQQQERNNQTKSGLPVHIGISIQKVYEVNVKRAAADLVVWFRMAWNDPRLAWDPEQYGGVDTVFIYPGTGLVGEDTEVFVPDITLWNQEQGMADSLSPTSARLSHTGDIFWSRPGRLKAACKFLGLENFPFDKLECTMEFGSWSYDGRFIRPEIDEGSDIDVGGSFTSGETYADVSIIDVAVEQYSYPPFYQQEHEWPVLLYHIKFKRAWEPYLREFFIRAIILNCIAFGCFWIPPKFTARLGLAMTSMLAAVAAEFTISQRLPVSSTWTFYGKVMVGSMMFTACVIFESVCVTHLDFCTKNDLLPPWYHKLLGKYRNWQRERRERNRDTVKAQTMKEEAKQKQQTTTQSSPEITKEETTEDDAPVDEPGSAMIHPTRIQCTSSDPSSLCAVQATKEDKTNNAHANHVSIIDVDDDHSEDDSSHHSQNSFHSHHVHPTDEQEQEEAADVIHELAQLEAKGHIPIPDPYDNQPTTSTMLYEDKQNESITHRHDEPFWKQKLIHVTTKVNSGKNQENPSIDCESPKPTNTSRASQLWSRLSAKLPNKSEIEKLNSNRWRSLAANIDEFCRLVFPLTYLLFISVSISIARKMESEDDFHSLA